MNTKYIDIIFAMIVFALPFNYIPRMLWQNFFGGPFGSGLVIYPLIIGLAYTVYCQWKYKNVVYQWNVFKKFAIVYLAVLFISLGWGLGSYPYYEQIFAGPVSQIEKLPKVLVFFHSMGISIAEKNLFEVWMSARLVKQVFFEVLYTFGAVYMIFCWYHNRVKNAMDILLKITTVNLVIIAAYGIVDVCYQNGQMWAQNFIAFTIPLFHGDVAAKFDYYQFHTHLFWDSQNRSIFLEPSFFGIYMAFTFPLLWWNIYKQIDLKKKIALYLLFICLIFEIFLTQSRTALAVISCILMIFALFSLYRMQKTFIRLIVALCIGSAIAFAGSLCFMNYGQVPSQLGEWTPLATKWQIMKEQGDDRAEGETTAEKYIELNLKSLSDSDKTGVHAGSNHSRFTLQKTNLQIGVEHPLLGVGISLQQGYLREKLDKDPGSEIQMWNKYIDKWEILYPAYANVGEFTLRFAETGLLGLGLYLLPSIFLLLNYGKILIKRKMNVEQTTPFIFSFLSFIGIMSTGLGGAINTTFCYWMAMAISFLALEKVSKN